MMLAILARRWRLRAAALPTHTGQASGGRRQRRSSRGGSSSAASRRAPVRRRVVAVIARMRSGLLLSLGAGAVLGFLVAQAAYLTGWLSLDGMLASAASCAAIVFALALRTGASAAAHAGTL
jgi:hypothetical protein